MMKLPARPRLRGEDTACDGETTKGAASVSESADPWPMSDPAHHMTISSEPPSIMAAMPEFPSPVVPCLVIPEAEEFYPLSAVLTVVAIGLWCVWATHCSMVSSVVAGAHKSTPELFVMANMDSLSSL